MQSSSVKAWTSDLDVGNKRATDGTESSRAQTNSNPEVEAEF